MRVLLPLILAGAVLAQDTDKPFLGMKLRPLNAEEAKKLGVQETEGLIVVYIAIGSPARAAGVMPLDILLSINGKEMKTEADFKTAAAAFAVGENLALRMSRKSEVVELSATLVSRRAWEDEWLLPGHPMPEFVVDEWIGEGPASEKDLRGSVVILDFWTMT